VNFSNQAIEKAAAPYYPNTCSDEPGPKGGEENGPFGLDFRLHGIYAFTMARPKEFDPAEALKTAVDVFWRLGYERTSVDDLMREMRISKQSLYNTFGDKRSLYFRAMAHYRDETNARLLELFTQHKSAKKAFSELLMGMARESKAQHERGCLLLNTNLSRPIEDVQLAQFLRDNQKDVESIFTKALKNAQTRGEIGRRRNPAALAKFFVATIQGMRALGRLNHDRRELEAIAVVAMASLK
jgi:TetR/AcrR family transcriptional repressor of nem operon